MPVLKLKHVVSFSSEDEKHPADNILKPETYFKWKCANGGEPNATIVLQLEKATQISGLDIGNNGSAFIEVLVGRSSWSNSEEYNVLLAASSFMTPADSKSGKEINRVRMFTLENLNKSVSDEKWDQMKVICTQPYNLKDQYGLSFLKGYSPVVEQAETDKKETPVTFGRFKMKNDDEESSSLPTGSFFQRRMNIPVKTPVTPKMSMAASARSSDPSPRTDTIYKTKDEEQTSSKKINLSGDCRLEVANALFKGSEGQPKKGNIFHGNENTLLESKAKIDTKRKLIDEDNSQQPNKKFKDTSFQKYELKKVKTKIKLKKKGLAYNKILQGVVFAVSGYQNPERGNLRDLALSMGAKYEPSWSERCTHLICAFANTPKYKEVIGKGIILKKKWIEECDKNKHKVNTKDYRLDNGGDSTFESSDDSDTENVKSNVKAEKHVSSECDTEGELEKIRIKEEKDKKMSDNQDDIYNVSTDENDNEVESNKNLILSAPSPKSYFFKDKCFFFYGVFDVKDSRLLKRYINESSGKVSKYMTDDVSFVISQKSWDNNFDKAFKDNPLLKFIQPLWLFKCHEKQEFVSYESYEIKSS